MGTIRKRILPCILAAVLLLAALPVTLAAETDGVGYRVRAEYDQTAGTLTATVSIHGVQAVCGRFALGFDPAMLELPVTSSLSRAIETDGVITLTGEGQLGKDLLSNTKGHVMFAWYPYGAAVDARERDYDIGTVTFRVKDGAGEEDFNSRTLYLYCVADGYRGWNTSAWIRGSGGGDYSNCVPGQAPCELEFDYPGSEREAPDLRTVTIEARDSGGKTMPGGTVVLEGQTESTGSSGAVFHLPDGIYTCMVTIPGYEERTATVEVSGGSVYRYVQLKSLQQLVDDVAAGLEIGFQGEDTAEAVTRDVIFPTEGEQNTKITWKSSDPNVLNDNGSVFRISQSVQVTATATVEKDGRTAEKVFPLTITAKTVPPTVLPGREDGDPSELPGGGQEGEEQAYTFRDIGGVAAWAGEAIETLHALGVINGRSKNTFAPGDRVTRGEYVTMMMRLLAPEGEPGKGFSDVPAGSYYHDAILLAQGLGIAKGVAGGRYDPNGSITRQDMMTLTYRTLDALGVGINPAGGEGRLSRYPDQASVSPYAREALGAMLQAGYIKGKGGALAPQDTTTRAEAAVLLYRIWADMVE